MFGDFPGDPVVNCMLPMWGGGWGTGSIPDQGTEILCAALYGPKFKKKSKWKENTVTIRKKKSFLLKYLIAKLDILQMLILQFQSSALLCKETFAENREVWGMVLKKER